MNNVFSLNIFSKYRPELMGVATLLIILCHASAFGVEMPGYIKTILGNGGIGVDMFLFLSGIGMYNSFQKVKRKELKLCVWYYRRWVRIVVPCLILILSITYALSFIREVSWGTCLLEISGFGFIVRKGALWFLSCILMLYILTPLLDHFISRKSFHVSCLLIIVCLIMAYTHILPGNFTFCIQRWPCYIIGYYVAGRIREKKSGNIFLWGGLPLLGYALCFLANHTVGTHFSLFWMQGIAVVSLVAYGMDAVSCRQVNRMLVFLGGISLESYITNEYVLRYLQSLFKHLYITPTSNLAFYVGGTVLCIAVSFLANKLGVMLIKRIS